MNWAIILAAGEGTRFKSSKNKMVAPLLKKPVIYHTLHTFEHCSSVDAIVLVVSNNLHNDTQINACMSTFTKIKKITTGGLERAHSVWNGLQCIEATATDFVAIHDGARCLVTGDIIKKSFKDAIQFGSSAVGIPVVDTLKEVNSSFQITKTHPREKFFKMQTPQTFRLEQIRHAYLEGLKNGFLGTDDASYLEQLHMPVHLTLGSDDNIKITTPIDMLLAETLIMRRKQCGH